MNYKQKLTHVYYINKYKNSNYKTSGRKYKTS